MVFFLEPLQVTRREVSEVSTDVRAVPGMSEGRQISLLSVLGDP